MPFLGDKMKEDAYMENFIAYFSDKFDFLNKKKFSNKGFLDIGHYYKHIDYVFLNWIEDLPDKRGGWIQSFLFIAMVYLFKAKRIKIIWVLHNKVTHYDSNRLLKGFLFRFIMRKCDYIITHSREGLSYLDRFSTKYAEKARYYAHPMKKKPLEFKTNPSVDILIWGSVIPYKGIHKFLQYLHENDLENRYRVLIAGKVKPKSYEKSIMDFCNDHIHLDNRYIPDEDLARYIADSKAILFTYVGDSVLSSGILMISLAFGANIIAPNVGAFKDAQEDGLIHTYETYADVAELLNKNPGNQQTRTAKIDTFIQDNTWSKFSQRASSWIIESEQTL